jgi:hypothetical protein
MYEVLSQPANLAAQFPLLSFTVGSGLFFAFLSLRAGWRMAFDPSSWRRMPPSRLMVIY